jgi:hypothetical protein
MQVLNDKKVLASILNLGAILKKVGYKYNKKKIRASQKSKNTAKKVF